MNKINVLGVIIKHYKTMSDQRGTMLMSDITVHFIVPLSLSFVLCWTYGIMKPAIASVFVNFGAITTALLMSAVIMIYEQKQKTITKISDIIEGNKSRDKLISLNTNKTIYEQLCHNVAYAILTSIVLVIFSVIIYFLPDNAVDLMKWYFRAPAYIVMLFSLYILFYHCHNFLNGNKKI